MHGVQLSDNKCEICSSMILFRGEIVIIQVNFNEDIFFFGHSKDSIVKIMLLPKPVDKILLPYNISDLFRRRLQIAIFPVQLASIQLPCFPTKIFNNAPVNASLIFWFYSLEKICPVTWTLPWEITKYLIDRQTFWSNRNDPYAGIWTTQKGGRLSMHLGRHK